MHNYKQFESMTTKSLIMSNLNHESLGMNFPFNFIWLKMTVLVLINHTYYSFRAMDRRKAIPTLYRTTDSIGRVLQLPCSESILEGTNLSLLKHSTKGKYIQLLLLQMCNLKYTDETRPNAEFISPGGHTTKLPVLCVGAFVVSEFEPIASLVEKKGISLTRDMDADLKADLRAFLSLVEKIFSLAELYITWMNESVLPITLERNGAVYPWILKQYQNWRKRRQVIKLLRIHEWDKMNMDEVVDMVDKMCKNLSDKLGNNQYFYGDQ